MLSSPGTPSSVSWSGLRLPSFNKSCQLSICYISQICPLPLPPLPAPSSVTWITAVAFLSLMPLLPPSLLQSILHSAIKGILLNPMTVHISPLLTTLPWPSAHSVKAKVLTMGYKVLYGSVPLPPEPSFTSPPTPVSLTCTTLTTQTSLVYFEQIRHIPTSGS